MKCKNCEKLSNLEYEIKEVSKLFLVFLCLTFLFAGLLIFSLNPTKSSIQIPEGYKIVHPQSKCLVSMNKTIVNQSFYENYDRIMKGVVNYSECVPAGWGCNITNRDALYERIKGTYFIIKENECLKWEDNTTQLYTETCLDKCGVQQNGDWVVCPNWPYTKEYCTKLSRTYILEKK